MGEAASIDVTEFDRVDMCVGRVVEAEPFPEARKPAYRLLEPTHAVHLGGRAL